MYLHYIYLVYCSVYYRVWGVQSVNHVYYNYVMFDANISTEYNLITRFNHWFSFVLRTLLQYLPEVIQLHPRYHFKVVLILSDNHKFMPPKFMITYEVCNTQCNIWETRHNVKVIRIQFILIKTWRWHRWYLYVQARSYSYVTVECKFVITY